MTDNLIAENKQRYLDLIKSINVEGSDIPRLINWLNSSDFFEAPASTKYHGAYKGGLCEHSLNVYDTLCDLARNFCLHEYSEDTLKIVALMHDISKANYYEQYNRNVKDMNGNWTQVVEYKVRDNKDRFIYGNHEQNSEFIAHTFFPLSVEESCAILHHHGGMGFDSSQVDLTPIYNKYSLACLLHVADMISCYIKEKI